MPLDNRDLLARAVAAAEQPGRLTEVKFPNAACTEPGVCEECEGPLPIPRRRDALVCGTACRRTRNRRLDAERRAGARTSLTG